MIIRKIILRLLPVKFASIFTRVTTYFSKNIHAWINRVVIIMDYISERPIISLMIKSGFFQAMVFFGRLKDSLKETLILKIKKIKKNIAGEHHKYLLEFTAYVNALLLILLLLLLLLMRAILLISLITSETVAPVVSVVTAYITLVASIVFLSINGARLYSLNRCINQFDPSSEEHKILSSEQDDLKKKFIFNTSMIVYGIIGVIALSINPIIFACMFATTFICYKVYLYMYPESRDAMNFLSSGFYVTLVDSFSRSDVIDKNKYDYEEYQQVDESTFIAKKHFNDICEITTVYDADKAVCEEDSIEHLSSNDIHPVPGQSKIR